MMNQVPDSHRGAEPGPDASRAVRAETGRETARIMSVLERAGELLELQLLFVVFSIPIVTIVPAAVALQRRVKANRLESGGLARRFVAEFAAAWKTCWVVGLVVPSIFVVGLLSALLWSTAPAAVAAIGLGLLVPLALAAGAAYLVYLGTAGAMTEESSGRQLASDSLKALFARPVPAFAASLALGAWIALLLRVPTIGLVGSGLVPAVLAWIAVRPRNSSDTERSA